MVAIRQRALEFGSRSEISARSVLVTIFGDSIVPTGGEIWLGDLIELAAPFGFSDRLVRTSMYRLTAEDWFHTERVGRRSRYRLTGLAERDFADAEARIYGGDRPEWDGRWTLVLSGEATCARSERDKLSEALSARGFARLAGGVFAFPGDGRDAFRRSAALAGVDGSIPTASARFDEDPFGSDRALVDAFDLDAAADRYRDFLDRYGWASTTTPESDSDAFAVRTMVVHDLRRATLLEPWLPARLLPIGWPGEKARDLAGRAYSRVADGAWRRLAQVAGLAPPSPDHAASRRFAPAAVHVAGS